MASVWGIASSMLYAKHTGPTRDWRSRDQDRSDFKLRHYTEIRISGSYSPAAGTSSAAGTSTGSAPPARTPNQAAYSAGRNRIVKAVAPASPPMIATAI